MYARPSVNFTNILTAAVAPIFLHQKSPIKKLKYKKAANLTFVQKNLLKNVGQIDSCILWSDSKFESKTPALKPPPQDRKLNQDEFQNIIQKYLQIRVLRSG
jgi:hypothetical protein